MPLQFVGADGKLTGFSIEIVKEIQRLQDETLAPSSSDIALLRELNLIYHHICNDLPEEHRAAYRAETETYLAALGKALYARLELLNPGHETQLFIPR